MGYNNCIESGNYVFSTSAKSSNSSFDFTHSVGFNVVLAQALLSSSTILIVPVMHLDAAMLLELLDQEILLTPSMLLNSAMLLVPTTMLWSTAMHWYKPMVLYP